MFTNACEWHLAITTIFTQHANSQSKIVTTHQQCSCLLDLLQQHPEMALGFTKYPTEEVNKFWGNIANSIAPPTKDATIYVKTLSKRQPAEATAAHKLRATPEYKSPKSSNTAVDARGGKLHLNRPSDFDCVWMAFFGAVGAGGDEARAVEVIDSLERESLILTISNLHKEICVLCPNKVLPNPSSLGHVQFESNKPDSTPPSRPISVPTAAALKMGVGFPLIHLGPPGTKVDSSRLISMHAKSSPIVSGGSGSTPTTPTLNVLTFECGICKRSTDQHLLAKCDTCQLHYHLSCLNPPLTRHPKKTKLYGWQCSECDKSEDSECATEIPKGPRKSRTRFNKDGSIIAANVLETESDCGPSSKRHSTDTTTPKMQITKKAINNFSNINEGCGSGRTTPKMSRHSPSILAKKTKCYVPLQNITKKLHHPAQLQTSPMKKILPQQVNTIVSDEPLLLVMPSNAKPRTTDAVVIADPDPLALPMNNNTTVSSMEDSSDPNKQARKQKRKDKHKSRHNISSDTDKSPNKEHKRKHKKKIHSHCAANRYEDSGVTIPKIKIKFKTLPLPGEVTPEAQFFYVSADMVRSAEEASRPTSVETVEDSAPTLTEERQIGREKSGITNLSTDIAALISSPATRKSSPRKTAGKRYLHLTHSKSAVMTPSTSNCLCCVCKEVGVSCNTVTCDECHKHYHFTCLDPPLKKTPKIRGYSWHCADCDPTDEDKK
ncbi:uncharacterized protein [Eurosta solidaginis]|uniref:uncharacterized protein n=1 Tax=Eurosta solidaginis TaxID=178769 RepID=UPI0035307055